MVRWIILACLVVVLTLAGTLALVYSPETSIEPAIALHQGGEELPPKLELVGPPEFNFGTMPKRTDGVHAWQIKNVGASALDLWLEETSCSCTVAKLSEEKASDKGGEKSTVTIPPGKSRPIEVRWETRNWNQFAQTVTLGTNDPATPSLTLIVRGKVLLPVAVEPSETVALGNVFNEETHRADLTILSPDQAGLKLTKVLSSKPGLIVAEVKPIPAEEIQKLKVKSGYTLAITVKPGLPVGPFREELVIQTNHPDQPEVKVTIAGSMTGPITVHPAKLEMLNVLSRTGAARDFSLLVRGEKEIHFQVAQAPAKVKVAVVHDETSRLKGRYRVTVTVPPGTPAGLIDEPIVLKTDHPKVSEVKIPVSIIISRSNAS